MLATYAFDPTIIADSLRMLATENKYDLGGKLVFSSTYPYGLTKRGVDRAFLTQYAYDRLGRIDYINVKKGGVMPASLARYEYYPTGAVKRVTLGDAIALDYTYHISGAVKTAVATNLADNSTLFSEALYYEDCGSSSCKPRYNGNISRMVHSMSVQGGYSRVSDYAYDFMNRLAGVDDQNQDEFDEYFAYDAQGRITSQRRGSGRGGDSETGGEYSYYAKTNRLEKVADGMGGESADKRSMSASGNFVYDSEGNLVEDKSKDLKISYDWRGMPVNFTRFECRSVGRATVCDSTKLVLRYDGSGRRVSKTRMMKTAADGDWLVYHITHYTGIGTEVRENYNGGSTPETKVVVNMPQGLGRYTPEDAVDGLNGVSGSQLAGYRPPAKFEWYLKNHLGSTMLVYGTQPYNDPLVSGYKDGVKVAYDYRAFGERVDYTVPTDKITETFTGKELDDETQLSNHGARMLDPMLGMWISVDPKRFFPSPYLYMGNGYNPIRFADLNGMAPGDPFDSPLEAAQDFARLYNGVSIATSTEYGTSIYRKGDNYYYTEPLWVMQMAL